MAFFGGMLKYVEAECDRAMFFHEYGLQPSIEAGLWVVDARKLSDQLMWYSSL
jgi:hypothetical protein